MRSIISHSVVLPAPAERLFAMYIDPANHAAITGAPVAISAEPGAPFQAFNGALTGSILQIIPQRLVIQSWRSTKFNDGDPDEKAPSGGPLYGTRRNGRSRRSA
jgi:activator of HSP90 ATPase